jgi:hypothetical protein
MTKVQRADPRLIICCHFGTFFGRPACFSRRLAWRFAHSPVPTTTATIRASTPSVMSIAGLTVCFVVLSVPEFFSQLTITTPSVMPVVIAPSQ